MAEAEVECLRVTAAAPASSCGLSSQAREASGDAKSRLADQDRTTPPNALRFRTRRLPARPPAPTRPKPVETQGSAITSRRVRSEPVSTAADPPEPWDGWQPCRDLVVRIVIGRIGAERCHVADSIVEL